METDSFFYQLLKKLPETLFALLDEPFSGMAEYRFDAVEVRKSYRLDGLFVPTRKNLPIYFVEVQFRRTKKFYANLFAKVFSYLEANDPERKWVAMAIFGNRGAEPRRVKPYEELLGSQKVRRIYLDELTVTRDSPPGLTILQLVSCSKKKTAELVASVNRQARQEVDSERADLIVELMEEILIRRYAELDREEIRRMFKLADIRKTRVWQEAVEEGKAEIVARLVASGQSLKDIANLLKLPIAEVRRLSKQSKS